MIVGKCSNMIGQSRIQAIVVENRVDNDATIYENYNTYEPIHEFFDPRGSEAPICFVGVCISTFSSQFFIYQFMKPEQTISTPL